ncbi:MAG: alpha-1,2-fucosyltransferase, partial [Spirochaetaceae bacterium]|nr:alpha-1,2-fucosyltransferase [Spirochaetaceae bacterium]
VRRKYFTKRSHYLDKVFRFDPAALTLSGDRYVEGWWQTERYFAPVADMIRDELTFGLDPGSRNVELLDSLAGRSLASVHVRRGDALKNPDTWVCTDHYYKGAFTALRKYVVDLFFVVFSDDLDWCRSSLGLPEGSVVFVDWNRGEDSWRDLWLMSRCASHVVANSTFSWWGAWLDPSQEKLVLAPGLWSLAKPRPFSYYRYDFTQVVPDSWLRIPISPA